MIGGHAQVRDAADEHPEDRSDDAAHRSQLLRSGPVEGRCRGEEVAEQLERPVDELNDHDRNIPRGGRRRKLAYRSRLRTRPTIGRALLAAIFLGHGLDSQEPCM